ncbi:MAG: hypothetical protein AAFX94_14445, partial [Myxococcota bacterium]
MTRFLLAAGLTVLGSQSAFAAANDVRLRGLGRPGVGSSTGDILNDPAVQRYRAMTGELSLALTPKAAQPAETLGVSGFEFSIVNSLTNINQDEAYWTGQPGSPVFQGVQSTLGRLRPSATPWNTGDPGCP